MRLNNAKRQQAIEAVHRIVLSQQVTLLDKAFFAAVAEQVGVTPSMAENMIFSMLGDSKITLGRVLLSRRKICPVACRMDCTQADLAAFAALHGPGLSTSLPIDR